MVDQEINIPKALHELHGEKTKLTSLVLVYLAALIISGITLFQLIPLALPVWKTVLVAVVSLDVGGGVVANLSSSTNQYYQRKANLRIVFLALHVMHPLLLMVVFPQSTAYFVFVMVFTLGSAFLVNLLKKREFQQNVAAALLGVGVCLSFFFPLSIPFLYAFAPLFMVKLILGFSVKRPDFDL